MKFNFENFDSKKFWKKQNEKVLSGESEGRQMPVFETETEYFENIFANQEFKNRIINLHKKFIEFKEKYGNERNKNQLLNGYTIFGSFVNQTPKKESDIDVVFFNEWGFINNFEIFHDLEKTNSHVQQGHFNFESFKLSIKSISFEKIEEIGGSDLFSLKRLFLGIPFGQDLQNFQKQVLDYINNFERMEEFWNNFSKLIYVFETGDSRQVNAKDGEYLEQSEDEVLVPQKYVILNKKPLTFAEFVERWQKRCDFVNTFCEKENLHF